MLKKSSLAAGLAHLSAAQWNPASLGKEKEDRVKRIVPKPMFSRYQIAQDTRLQIEEIKRQVQSFADDEPPTREACSRAVNRIKNDTADFNEIFRQANADPTFAFEDPTFVFPESIVWDDVPALAYPLTDDIDYISWTRIKDAFKDDNYSMWGKNNVEPDDAIQGQLGNCWLHVAAMSLAQDPQRIKDAFLVDEKNTAGVYAMQMYLLGIPVSVVIDDYLPLTKKWTGEMDTLYADIGDDKALWGTIFEKTFAKYLGQYEAIDAGLGSHGIEAMIGSPYSQWTHEQVTQLRRENLLWDALVRESAEGAMITSGSYTGSGNDQDRNEVGIPYNHAFSIMYPIEVIDAQGEIHRLVCLRNPWGMEYYDGDWSDKSSRWTDDLREQAGHKEKNDGKYFMPFDDYVEYMEYTDFNRDISNLYLSTFAVFADDKPRNRQQVFYEDPTEYNVHTLYVYSEEPQKISLSAHSYHFKQYHGACLQSADQTEVLIQTPGGNILYPVWPGSYHGDYEQVQAGVVEVNIFTRFGENDLLPHDWSLIVWSEKSEVTITHADGLESGTFRNLSVDESVPVPTDFSESARSQNEGSAEMMGKTLIYALEQSAGDADFIFNESITIGDEDNNTINYSMTYNGEMGLEGVFTSQVSEQGTKIDVQFGDKEVSCTIPKYKTSCRDIVFVTPQQTLLLIHSLDETKLIFSPDTDYYKVQIAWIFDHETKSFTRKTTSFEDSSITTITWVCIDETFFEIDREGDYTSVNWYQPSDEETQIIAGGEDMTLAYVTEHIKENNIYMFSELATFGNGGEFNLQAQRNGEIVDMRTIQVKISADSSSMSVRTDDFEFFCSINDKDVCTQRKILDDDTEIEIVQSMESQSVVFYPNPVNLNAVFTWTVSPFQNSFNRTTEWLDDGTVDTIVWQFSEMGFEELGIVGDFEAVAWTDSLGNFNRYSKEKSDENPPIDNSALENIAALELNYQLESHVFDDVYSFSESVKFMETGAEIKFMTIFNGSMIDQGILNAIKSEDLQSVQVFYGPTSIGCEIEEGKDKCEMVYQINAVTSILIDHSQTRTRIKYTPNLQLYPIEEEWEFNHILQTFNKTVTTLEDERTDTIVWSISSLGLQEKLRSGDFKNVIWLQNVKDASVGFQGMETLALDYIYETPRGTDAYLFTENVVFNANGAEISFVVLLNGGFMDSREFSVSLSEDFATITGSIGANNFSCSISASKPTCRAFSKFDEVSNMMIIHSIESTKIIYFPDQAKLDIQMIWEYSMFDMKFSKSTFWADTEETDTIVWEFTQSGARQFDREGDYTSLFWSDGLGNSGSLNDGLGPLAPEPEPVVRALAYQLNSCVFDDTYSSQENLKVGEGNGYEIVFSLMFNDDMLDQGVFEVPSSDMSFDFGLVRVGEQLLECVVEEDDSSCEDEITLTGSSAKLSLLYTKQAMQISYTPDQNVYDIIFSWVVSEKTFSRINYLPGGYNDEIEWSLNYQTGFNQTANEGFCGVSWVDYLGNLVEPEVEGPFAVTDVGVDNPIFFEVLLTSEKIGNITETITTGNTGEIDQTIHITYPDGAEAELRLNPIIDEGIAFMMFEVENDSGDVEDFMFLCYNVCEESKETEDFTVTYSIDVFTNETTLIYEFNTDPRVVHTAYFNPMTQVWNRNVTVDTEVTNDDGQTSIEAQLALSKDWSYEFLDQQEVKAFEYYLEIVVYGNELFVFNETLQMLPGISNFTYLVTGGDEVADSGNIQFVLADPDNQKITFGENQMLCVVDSSRQCTVRFYDAEKQRNWVYIYQKNGDFSMTFQTQFYTMIVNFDSETMAYTRQNQFFDGTETEETFDLNKELRVDDGQETEDDDAKGGDSNSVDNTNGDGTDVPDSNEGQDGTTDPADGGSDNGNDPNTDGGSENDTGSNTDGSGDNSNDSQGGDSSDNQDDTSGGADDGSDNGSSTDTGDNGDNQSGDGDDQSNTDGSNDNTDPSGDDQDDNSDPFGDDIDDNADPSEDVEADPFRVIDIGGDSPFILELLLMSETSGMITESIATDVLGNINQMITLTRPGENKAVLSHEPVYTEGMAFLQFEYVNSEGVQDLFDVFCYDKCEEMKSTADFDVKVDVNVQSGVASLQVIIKSEPVVEYESMINFISNRWDRAFFIEDTQEDTSMDDEDDGMIELYSKVWEFSYIAEDFVAPSFDYSKVVESADGSVSIEFDETLTFLPGLVTMDYNVERLEENVTLDGGQIVFYGNSRDATKITFNNTQSFYCVVDEQSGECTVGFIDAEERLEWSFTYFNDFGDFIMTFDKPDYTMIVELDASNDVIYSRENILNDGTYVKDEFDLLSELQDSVDGDEEGSDGADDDSSNDDDADGTNENGDDQFEDGNADGADNSGDNSEGADNNGDDQSNGEGQGSDDQDSADDGSNSSDQNDPNNSNDTDSGSNDSGNSGNDDGMNDSEGDENSDSYNPYTSDELSPNGLFPPQDADSSPIDRVSNGFGDEIEWETYTQSYDLLSFKVETQSLNATAIYISFTVSDSTGIGYDCFLNQIIKVNETNKAISMMDCDDLEYAEDTSLDLQSGFQQIDFQWQRNDFTIRMRLSEDQLEQIIVVDGQDYYLHNTIDFASKMLTTGMVYAYDIEVSDYAEKSLADDVFTCIGLLEADDIINTEEIYEDGFDEGYSAGYNDGNPGEAEQEPINSIVMTQAQNRFPAWVKEQELTSGVFACNDNVRIDQPFPGEKRFWALWAQHDCIDYDLKLTVVLNKRSQDNFVGFIGGSLSENGCVDIYWMENTVACEFKLEAGGENFGILFQGELQPLFYETEWVLRNSKSGGAFSWW